MRNSKKLAFICLLLFLLTIVTVTLHHHHDGCLHDDCPICLTAVAIAGASVGFAFFTYAVFIVASMLEPFDAPPCYNGPTLYHPPTRAPPA
ncbi:MAG: hypothetical protein M0Z81_18920 [Deltaproteobacteria bacterium]|jgi:hypothetical protein|nr:hypothetical protein [Deltaproteobacteria bacterium]